MSQTLFSIYYWTIKIKQACLRPFSREITMGWCVFNIIWNVIIWVTTGNLFEKIRKQYKNNFNKHMKLSKNRSRHNWGIPNIGPTDMKFYTKENPYIPFYWKIYPWKDGRRKIVITSLPLARHCAFLTMQGNLFVHAIGRLHPLCLSIYLDVATFIDDINFKVI